tara:strand:- start:1027 stop:1512 length:486 start_codon:yes stop_codon:yes gene_type:complete
MVGIGMARDDEIKAAIERFQKASRVSTSAPVAPAVKKKRKPKSALPTENQEQRAVVKVLREHKIPFIHVPNEGRRNKVNGWNLKMLGLSPGFPDLICFQSPPKFPNSKGLAIEMKRAKKSSSRVSPEQKEWLKTLEQHGFICMVAFGAAEAIAKLEELGYI